MQLDFCQLTLLQQQCAVVSLTSILLIGQLEAKKEKHLLNERSVLVEQIYQELQNTKTFSALENEGSMSPQKSPKAQLQKMEPEKRYSSSTTQSWQEMFKVDKEDQKGLLLPHRTLENLRKMNRVKEEVTENPGLFDFCQKICKQPDYDIPGRMTPITRERVPPETSMFKRLNETPLHNKMKTPTSYMRT